MTRVRGIEHTRLGVLQRMKRGETARHYTRGTEDEVPLVSHTCGLGPFSD